jgi:hypothetical protein
MDKPVHEQINEIITDLNFISSHLDDKVNINKVNDKFMNIIFACERCMQALREGKVCTKGAGSFHPKIEIQGDIKNDY